jgi:hypothetical protein
MRCDGPADADADAAAASDEDDNGLEVVVVVVADPLLPPVLLFFAIVGDGRQEGEERESKFPRRGADGGHREGEATMDIMHYAHLDQQ